MKAMILAAGVGKRLRPLTDVCPKVLVPIVNKPMIDRAMEFLAHHGVREIIINAHHQYQRIIDYLEGRNFRGIQWEVRVEKKILGTGGGIKNTQNFWGKKPFIVINGDILTDVNLKEVYAYHRERDNLVTMVLHDFPAFNKIRTDSDMNIRSIGPGTMLKGALAFTGIHVINPEVLDCIPKDRQYNILTCYKRLMELKKPVRGYLASGHSWVDIGTLASYVRANVDFLPREKFAVDSECTLAPDADLKEWAVIGKRCAIKRRALVKRSILWEDIIVSEGVSVVDSVVASGAVVKKDLVGGVAIR